jgi:pimeloyl-ACP methyl ester carboxylesterase
MHTQIAFVHGIGRHRQPEDECRKWSTALATGFREAGHSDLAKSLTGGAGVTTHFIYYRDLFDTPLASGGRRPDLTDDDAAPLAALVTETIEEQLALTDDPAAVQALRHAHAEINRKGEEQGLGDLLGKVINAATTLLTIKPLRLAAQWASAKVFAGSLAQVSRYLDRAEKDCDGFTLDQRIRKRIVAELGPGPVIVISHSLGTVVTLEALNQYDGTVPLWVTLGSPIGMRGYVWPRLSPQPPRTPECVATWLNYWDKDDFVVARRRLERKVLSNTAGVEPVSRRVDSDGLMVHDACLYLEHARVAGRVAEALKGLQAKVA